MEELEKAIIAAINESNMSYEAIRYVLKHVLEVVDLQYQNALLQAQIPVNESEVTPNE